MHNTLMIQKEFARQAAEILRTDDSVLGLAVAGSWLTDEIDEFSDLDLILVTREKVADDISKMQGYAKRLGHFLSGFTGEHVGEPRVLICLFDNPLLHVDIKFLTPEEFGQRIETPVILLDKGGRLNDVLMRTEGKFPYPDYQWVEDRFWIWIHYALLKTGRGEYVEALDFMGFMRMTVLGPLLHIKNDQLPRGVRKAEQLPEHDFEQLKATIPSYSRTAVLQSLDSAVSLYRDLRSRLFPAGISLQAGTEKRVMEYFDIIRLQMPGPSNPFL